MKIIFNVSLKDRYLKNVYLWQTNISTQKDLAKRIGIHEKSISRILGGKINVSMKTAKKLCVLAHNIDFEELFKT